MKTSRTFRTLLILILSVTVFFVFLFVVTLSKQHYKPRKGYELPRRVVEFSKNTEDFHVVKISHSLPVSSPIQIALNDKISFEIQKDPSRNIIPEIYPANQLGSPGNQFLAVQKGTIEMIVANAADLWQFSEFGLFSEPFRISAYEELEEIMAEPKRVKELSVFFRRHNVKLLGWSYGSYSHIVSTLFQSDVHRDSIIQKRPNEALEHYFKGKGLTVYSQNPSLSQVEMRNQNHTLVEVSSEELVKAAEEGLVDDIYLRNYLLSPFLYLINLNFWSSLSLEEKALLEKSILQTIQYQKELVLEANRDFQLFFDEEFGE